MKVRFLFRAHHFPVILLAVASGLRLAVRFVVTTVGDQFRAAGAVALILGFWPVTSREALLSTVTASTLQRDYHESASLYDMTKRFPPQALAGFEATKYMYIRAGDHRFIPIWVVVVEGRVIVRSWNDKPGGWYRAFLSRPRGHVQIDDREVPIRAVRVGSKRLNGAADDAYAAKYTTKANTKYVKGLTTPGRKATTLELIPA